MPLTRLADQPATADFIVHVHERAAKARAEIARTLAEDCQGCEGVASEVGRECTSRGDPTDGSEVDCRPGPICQWALAEATHRAARDREASRRDRLRTAGCTDPDALRLIPPAVDPPLPRLPAADLEGCRLAMESAAYALRHPEIRTLVLTGATGAGKSLAAAWALAGAHGSGCWMPATVLDSPDRWRATEPAARRADCLVLDDLGREHPSESGWSSEQLANLVTGRIDSGRRTIVTTNLTPPELGQRYGDRLLSRLRRDDAGLVAVGNIDLRDRLLRARRAGGQTTFAERVRGDHE